MSKTSSKKLRIVDESDDGGEEEFSAVEGNSSSEGAVEILSQIKKVSKVPKAGKKQSFQQLNEQRSNEKLERKISAYKKKVMKTQSKSDLFHDQLAMQNIVEFNFDSMGSEDISDTPGQSIVKKKCFPRGMVGVITKATFIDFHQKANGEREQLVCDIRFVFYLKNKQFVRVIEKEEIDYAGVSIRFHLPKRFQDRFEGMQANRLVGSLILSPDHDKKKWTNEKDAEKSSIPLMMLLKNAKSLESLGLVLEEFPLVADFINEANLSVGNEDYEPSSDAMKIIFDYFGSESKTFHARELHKTNVVR